MEKKKLYYVSGIITSTFTENVEAKSLNEAVELVKKKKVEDLPIENEELEITESGVLE